MMMLSEELESAVRAEIEREMQRRMRRLRESGEYWEIVEREVESQIGQTTVHFCVDDIDNPHIYLLGGDGEMLLERVIPMREVLEDCFDPTETPEDIQERLAIAEALEKCAMRLRQGEWK